MLGKVPKSTDQGNTAAVSGSQEARGKLKFWDPRDQHTGLKEETRCQHVS